ncbi:MAG: gluconokinase [Anaerolineae bacterium]|nr:gluconokinase [Anaerolineae bacterium]
MSPVTLGDAKTPLVLTLDIGTSSTRVLLFDALGRHVSGVEGRKAYTVHTTSDGGAELDPGDVLAAVTECIDQVMAQVDGERLRGQIAGVGACSLVTTMIGVADGHAVTPVYIWADTRSAPAAAQLRSQVDEGTVHDRTGCMIHPSYWPPRFLWLQHTRPELLERSRQWMSISEYIYLQLFGQTRCSYSVASWTGLLDRRRLVWDQEWLSRLPITEDQLPPLGDADTSLSGLRPEYARRWPALASTPWFLAIGDGAGSNLGSGCTTPRRIAINAGTSGAMRIVLPGTPDRVPQGLWCYRVDRHNSLLGGALSNTGNVYQWLRQTLQLPSTEEIERHLAEAEADGHSLTILPFLAGERAPGWAGHARAAIVGLRWHTQPLDILQAGLEAVAYRFALIYRLLSEAVEESEEVIVSGGAMLSSPAWTQILSDVLGRPVIASAETEATSRGAALLALKALGLIQSLDDAPPALGETFTPRPERHQRYQAAIERQQALYTKLVQQPLPD